MNQSNTQLTYNTLKSTNERKSRLIKQIILENENFNILVPLYVFPNIIQLVQVFLNIKSCTYIPSIITNQKSKQFIKIKQQIEINKIQRYLPRIQNTESYFSILQYLDFIPLSYSYRSCIINPFTCYVCPKKIHLDSYNIIKDYNRIYCSYECFKWKQNQKHQKNSKSKKIQLKKKNKIIKKIFNTYKIYFFF